MAIFIGKCSILILERPVVILFEISENIIGTYIQTL